MKLQHVLRWNLESLHIPKWLVKIKEKKKIPWENFIWLLLELLFFWVCVCVCVKRDILQVLLLFFKIMVYKHLVNLSLTFILKIVSSPLIKHSNKLSKLR